MNPTKDDVHDPYLLNNIDKVSQSIALAVAENKKISIFLDIDTDGITGGAILYKYLKNFTDNVCYFHAQRSMGHGLENAVNIIPESTDVLLIIDSSTDSWQACKEVSERGIEILIVDHHPSKKNNTYATIVNPHLDDYPNKDISGAGLAWKLCKVLDDIFNTYLADEYIDIAGIGMLGDMMDMSVLENRYIVSEAINNIKNPGLIALFKKKGKNPLYVNASDIVYTVTPMLNATARQDKIELGVRLIVTDDEDEIREIVKAIDACNEERKVEQSQFFKKFSSKVNPNDNIIIVLDNQIGKGYSGLVANQLAQHYKKPALILINDGKVYQGSYRSYGDFELGKYFETLPQVTNVGGHQNAGGIQVPLDKIKEFVIAANKGLEGVKFEQVIEYDLEIDAKDINEELIAKVKNFFKVTGRNFSEAKFLVNNLFVVNKDMLGKEVKETVKIECEGLDLLKFKTNEEFYESIPIFGEVKAIGTLNTNVFWKMGKNGKRQMVKTNQLLIEDLQVG
jgi:single-stranded-DNA-specific exonuclease